MSVYALNLLRQLVAAGHDVTMISQYRGDARGAAVYGGGPPPEVEGVHVIGLESTGEQAVELGRPADFEADIASMVSAALDEHKRAPFDVIHAQYGYPNGLAALEVSRRTGVPNLVSIQGGDGHWVGLCCRTHREAMRAVLNHAGRLLIGSESFAEEVRANHGTAPERFTIVPGAVDIDRFRPRPGWVLGSVGDPSTLLYHGRVDARKGVLDFVDATRLLAARGVRFRAIISGIGPDVAETKDRIESLGLRDRVGMSGYAPYDDVPSVYHRGDVFVSPTYSEGFSNTILEAMASGLPVVSCRSVGVVDCLEDGRNGLLVEPGDVEGLGSALARVLGDVELRARIAGAAMEDVRRLYCWPAVARQILDAYGQVVGSRPDDSWTSTYDIESIDATNADPNCRFRRVPHLL